MFEFVVCLKNKGCTFIMFRVCKYGSFFRHPFVYAQFCIYVVQYAVLSSAGCQDQNPTINPHTDVPTNRRALTYPLRALTSFATLNYHA